MKRHIYYVKRFINPGVSAVDVHNLLANPKSASFIFEQNYKQKNISDNKLGYVCISAEKIIRTGKKELLGETDPFKIISKELNERIKHKLIPAYKDLNEAFYSGGFGYISYECFKYIEPTINNIKDTKTYTPESGFIFPKELLIFDNKKLYIYIVCLKQNRLKKEIKKRQKEIQEKIIYLSKNLNKKNSSSNESKIKYKSNIGIKKYIQMVKNAIYEINNGELIQVVLSRKAEMKIMCDPSSIYRELKKINFSPYTYYVNFVDFQIIGASPELMSRTKSNITEIHPIAGTYPRDTNKNNDDYNEKNMLLSEKEKAEHLMLVDLARNDLGKICEIGSVKVEKFMSVEKYSHVMHLVSKVTGLLGENFSGIDALKSGFPIGTLSGAPKIRAIELANDLEPEGRGPYCGAIGWFENLYNIDTGTLIRSIIIKKQKAFINGGAGIVSESSPKKEYKETENKILACIQAINIANNISRNREKSYHATINR